MIRFWWNSVLRPNLTCWIQKTQHRRSDVIFQDSRRRHDENPLKAVPWPFMLPVGWNSVHRLILTCWIQNTQPRRSDASCQDGAAAMLKTPCPSANSYSLLMKFGTQTSFDISKKTLNVWCSVFQIISPFEQAAHSTVWSWCRSS